MVSIRVFVVQVTLGKVGCVVAFRLQAVGPGAHWRGGLERTVYFRPCRRLWNTGTLFRGSGRCVPASEALGTGAFVHWSQE